MRADHIIIVLLVIYIIYLHLPREGFTTREVIASVEKALSRGGNVYDEFIASLGSTIVSPRDFSEMSARYLAGELTHDTVKSILKLQ